MIYRLPTVEYAVVQRFFLGLQGYAGKQEREKEKFSHFLRKMYSVRFSTM